MGDRSNRSKITRQNPRMLREQGHSSLATWQNYATSASRRARVLEQSAQTCVEDHVPGCSEMFARPLELPFRLVVLQLFFANE